MVEEVTEETLTAFFMNGLTDDVQTKVKMFSLYCLEEMMEKALQVEDKNWILDTKMRLQPEIHVTRLSPKS